MTIRLRVYGSLGVLALFALAAIVSVALSYQVASQLEQDRRRFFEVLRVHADLSLTLHDVKGDQRGFLLSGSEELRARRVRSVGTFEERIAQLEGLLTVPAQKQRARIIRTEASAWIATFESAIRFTPPTSEEANLIIRDSDARFQKLASVVTEFEEQQHDIHRLAQVRASRQTLQTTLAVIVVASLGLVTMALLMVFAKRVLLDPLSRLTHSAEGIERGDFTAAHQTL